MPKFRFILLSLFVLCLPIITSAQTPIFSAENPIITPENASQVTQLAMIGRGTPSKIVYSPDNTMFAVASSIGIWIYDADNLGEEPRLLRDETQVGWMAEVAFSPDSRYIASGISAEFREGGDKLARVWDVQTGEVISRFLLEEHSWHVGFSPDGQFIVTTSGAVLQIWHIQSGKVAQTISGRSDLSVASFAYSPDGQFMVVGYLGDDYDTEIIVYRVATAEIVHQLDHLAYLVAYSPDGQFIATGGRDLRLWDAETAELIYEAQAETLIVDLAYSGDGRFIATVNTSNERFVAIYDAQTGEITQTLMGHQNVSDIAFSPDGGTLVSRSYDAIIKAWTIETGRLSHDITGFSSFINTTGYNAVTGQIAYSSFNQLRVVNMATLASHQGIDSGDLVWAYDPMEYHDSLDTLVYSPDGRWLAFQKTNRTIVVWDIQARGVAHNLINRNRDTNSRDMFNVVFSADSQTITAIDEAVIRIWDVTTGELLHTLEPAKTIHSLVYSPDGAYLALCGLDGDSDSGTYDVLVEIWETDTYTKADEMTLSDIPYGLEVIVTPQGEFLLYGDNEETDTVMIWDIETESVILELPFSNRVVEDILFSIDGQLIFGASKNHILVWDATTGDLLHTLLGHTEDISSMSRTPDGRYIVSNSPDGTVRVWGVPADG
jgi:WD40 repeat protein